MDEFQPQAAPDTEAIGFPVDLSREEYIAFNMLLAKNGGMLRFRKGQLVIFGLMMAFSLVMLAVEFFVFQSLDVVMILVVAFIALTGGFLLFGMPAYLRRNAGRAYDQSVLGGHEYYGMVYVYDGEGNLIEEYPDPNAQQAQEASGDRGPLPQTVGGMSLGYILMLGVVFLVSNIPTLIFGGIWLHFKNRRDLREDMKRMRIEDLG